MRLRVVRPKLVSNGDLRGNSISRSSRRSSCRFIIAGPGNRHSKIILKLKRRHQTGEQSGARRDVLQQDMFMRRVSAVAIDTQSVQDWNVERGDKVSVRGSADSRFFQIESDAGRHLAGVMKELDHPRRALERPPIYAAF